MSANDRVLQWWGIGKRLPVTEAQLKLMMKMTTKSQIETRLLVQMLHKITNAH